MGRLFLHLRSLNLVMKIGRANCEHLAEMAAATGVGNGWGLMEAERAPS